MNWNKLKAFVLGSARRMFRYVSIVTSFGVVEADVKYWVSCILCIKVVMLLMEQEFASFSKPFRCKFLYVKRLEGVILEGPGIA